jgi:hypothetical protein
MVPIPIAHAWCVGLMLFQLAALTLLAQAQSSLPAELLRYSAGGDFLFWGKEVRYERLPLSFRFCAEFFDTGADHQYRHLRFRPYGLLGYVKKRAPPVGVASVGAAVWVDPAHAVLVAISKRIGRVYDRFFGADAACTVAGGKVA